MRNKVERLFKMCGYALSLTNKSFLEILCFLSRFPTDSHGRALEFILLEFERLFGKHSTIGEEQVSRVVRTLSAADDAGAACQ